jgi:chondroitin 4-sulfotransferase 11
MNAYELDVSRRPEFNKNYSVSNNCIFIHIPKCAGNSIKKCIGGFVGDSHSFAKQIPVDLFKNSYSFAFVRNPWDRCLSAYYYLMKGGDRNPQDLIDRQEFIVDYPNFRDFVIKKGVHDAAVNQTHFLPQARFTEHRNFNFIGRVEDIKKDMQRVCGDLNVRFNLPHFNKGIKPSRDIYTRRMIDIITEIYQEDIETFQFNFSS